jgi:hypothetical protein
VQRDSVQNSAICGFCTLLHCTNPPARTNLFVQRYLVVNVAEVTHPGSLRSLGKARKTNPGSQAIGRKSGALARKTKKLHTLDGISSMKQRRC